MTFPTTLTRRTLAAAASALLLAVLLLSAARAEARSDSGGFSDCGPVEVSQPFAPWGDFSDYFAVGSFDDGAEGWAFSGDSGVAEVISSGNGGILSLGAGGEALSPPVCFDESRTHARFFVASPDGQRLRGDLEVEVVYTRTNGRLARVDAGEIDGRTAGSEWSPSPELEIDLGNAKIAPNAAGERMFQLHLEAEGKRTWEIDDVMVDPRRRQ